MNDKLKKMIRMDNICFYIGIIFIALIILCGVWAYSIFNTDLDNPPYLMDVDSVDTYAYVNTTLAPYAFASNSDETIWYALIMDGDNHLFIIKLTEEDYQKIENEIDENETISIKGVSRSIEDDIKKFTIESYNEVMEEDFLTDDNFNSYLGYYYLDLNGEVYDYSGPIITALMLFIFGGYFIIRGIKSKTVNKKIVNSDIYMKAMEEIDNPEWETNKAILTKNYIIFSDGGLHIIDYKDIAWVYRHTYRYNGVPNHSLAYYIRGSKKMHLISYGFKESTVDEMVKYISNKNKDTLVGYTMENRKLFKEML